MSFSIYSREGSARRSFASAQSAYDNAEPPDLDTPAIMGTSVDGEGFGIDFESDEPLVCNPNRPDGQPCESCQ